MQWNVLDKKYKRKYAIIHVVIHYQKNNIDYNASTTTFSNVYRWMDACMIEKNKEYGSYWVGKNWFKKELL